MIWLLLASAAVLASEAMLQLPLIAQAKSVIDVSGRSVRVLRSKRISDHWKERILPAYSARMFKGSVGFFISLCLALLPVVVLGFLSPGGLSVWLETLLTPLAILVLCAVSVGYIWLRLKVIRG
ncbi:MAG: hypothetical protein ACKVPY_11870 [Paracoccaceae bacterium]